jgi:hypothetical protein
MLTKRYIFVVKDRINFQSNFSGIDSPECCLNRKHFQNYKKKITYHYSSHGFRDLEWPDNLSDVIWCVGDSFTVGIGQSQEETWPQLLQKKIGKRCLNLGEDGCSNDTMYLRIKKIVELYNPKLIVVMWSYLHRRRIKNTNVHYEKDSFGFKNDIENFDKNFNLCQKLNVKLIHLIIPNACENMNYLKKKYPKLQLIKQLDYARDYHHFDIETSKYIVDLLVKKIKNFDF